MALDDILAGLGGALDGGLASYSWQKDRQLNERVLNEREQTRRDQISERSMDRMQRERVYTDQQDERKREAEATVQKQRIFDEWYATLTPEMQKVVKAKQFGVTADAEDFEDPAAKALRTKDAEAKKYLDDELKHTRTLETTGATATAAFDRAKKLAEFNHTLRMKEKTSAPVTPKDDPTLPSGVKKYLGSLVTKHAGNVAAAEGEWNRHFAGEQTKHPLLDPGKARQFLRNALGYEKPSVNQEEITRTPGFAEPDQPELDPEPDEESGWLDSVTNMLGLTPKDEPVAGTTAMVPPTEPADNVNVSVGLTPRGATVGDPNQLREQEATAAAETDRLRRSRQGSQRELRPDGSLLRELKDGTGRPTAAVIEVPDPPSDDPPQPGSPEATEDKLTQLGAQVDSLAAQFQGATNPATKAALKSQLAKAWAAYQKAGGQ